MSAARYFVMTGGTDAADLLDRAASHGPAGRAVAHATPHPTGCYGAVEVTPKTQQPERARAAGLTTGGDEGAGGHGAQRDSATPDESAMKQPPAPGEPHLPTCERTTHPNTLHPCDCWEPLP